MSKHICKPKTQHDIHKLLCAKSISPRSKYELLGPFNKYRDENYEIYKQKCGEFKAKALANKNENIKALSNHKPKLGIQIYSTHKDIVEESNDIKTMKTATKEKQKESEVTNGSSLSLLVNVRAKCEIIRRRHERYYYDFPDVSERLCYFDPWFKRYLVLTKFIAAARRVIIKNRMLKNLEKLKKLTKEKLDKHENEFKKVEHLSYGHIFDKFC